MGWTPDQPNPLIHGRFKDKARLCFTYTFANKCRAKCPCCIARGTPREREWTYEQAIAAWKKVLERHGPCYLIFSGYEPLEEPEFVGEILKYHYGSVCTNLMVDLDRLFSSVPSDRLVISASFHSQIWRDIDEFLEKLKRVRDRGFACEINLVGYPWNLPFWDEWFDKIRGAGFPAAVNPLFTNVTDGELVMYDYSEEEQQILKRYLPELMYDRDTCSLKEVKEGTVCAAGFVYAFISIQGYIARCPNYFDWDNLSSHPSLFDMTGIIMSSGPEVCNKKVCNCVVLRHYNV